MHVEMSLEENETPEAAQTTDEKPVDTQTISGSQVAAAFARIENEKNNNKSPSAPTLLVSLAAVMSLVALYFVLVLVL